MCIIARIPVKSVSYKMCIIAIIPVSIIALILKDIDIYDAHLFSIKACGKISMGLL